MGRPCKIADELILSIRLIWGCPKNVESLVYFVQLPYFRERHLLSEKELP